MNSPLGSDLPLILIGAGGHARVLQELAQASGRQFLGVCDPQLACQGITTWRGLPVLGGDEALEEIDPTSVGLVNGIGQLVGSQARRDLDERLNTAGFTFPTLVHPAAWVASSATLADGVQVMAGAIIQPDSRINRNVIINTRASVDHDCSIGQHVHIAPGATLCGDVQVGEGAFIGAGAVIIQGIRIGACSVVGAGVTLTRNLDAGLTMRRADARLKHQSH